MKKKKSAKARKKQKEKTDLIRSMYRAAAELEKDSKISMRGKHWRFEKPELRKLVLSTFKEGDFYNGEDRFVTEWLYKRVKSKFENKIVSADDYPVHGEKSIRAQIKELIKLGEISVIRKSVDGE
jgi:hypothetical protein